MFFRGRTQQCAFKQAICRKSLGCSECSTIDAPRMNVKVWSKLGSVVDYSLKHFIIAICLRMTCLGASSRNQILAAQGTNITPVIFVMMSSEERKASRILLNNVSQLCSLVSKHKKAKNCNKVNINIFEL